MDRNRDTTAFAPDVVKAAYDILNALESRTPMGLALRHGELGVHMMSACGFAIAVKTEDGISDKLLSDVWSDVQEIANNPQRYNKLISVLASALSVARSFCLMPGHDDSESAPYAYISNPSQQIQSHLSNIGIGSLYLF